VAPDTTGEQDLRTYLRILWRWKFLFLAFVVLVPLAAFLIERRHAKVYQSSTLIEFQNVSTGSGTISIAPIASGNLDAISRLVTTTPVIDTAARLLGRPPGSIAGEVSASADPTTGFLTISATDRDPARAAAIANAFAAALANRQAAQARTEIRQQVRTLQRQLAVTPPSQAGARLSLQQQISQTQALIGSAASGAQVVQAATPSASPIAPATRRDVELALVIGVLLGLGAVLIAENADRRMRMPEDVESLTGWPLLAPIPPGAFSPDHLAEPGAGEAFQMLRTALTYFNVEEPLRSVAVVSAVVGDGKTTVATGLALATAQAGKRAILVDADLRHPRAGARLGLEPKAGLGAVLAGGLELADALLPYPVDSPGAGSLLVLPAGPPPPNPTALLGSEAMRETLRELEGAADLVIVDTVATLAVSDALPLFRAVSGCVVVVRMNRSSRAAVRRLKTIIASARGTVLGFAATGSGAAAGGYAYYPYAQDGRGTLGLLHLRRQRRRASSTAASSNGSSVADGVEQPTE
jgi:capsular exopolysaccharide synthesis family protein